MFIGYTEYELCMLCVILKVMNNYEQSLKCVHINTNGDKKKENSQMCMLISYDEKIYAVTGQACL